VLRLLLCTPLELDALPPAEVFWSPARRQVYEAILFAAQAMPPGRVVDLHAVRGSLEPASEAVAILARLGGDLPESLAASHWPELANRLELIKRQRKRSRRDLAREILEAQQAGDHERLEELTSRMQDVLRERKLEQPAQANRDQPAPRPPKGDSNQRESLDGIAETENVERS
jgi:hypothetical protein